MGPIGPTELIVVLVVVILLFGAGRVGDLGGALGKSIREFRSAVKGEDEKKEKKEPKSQA
ncbi:MAG: twin-arginine translocase TatA/TatE family subunit [Bacteroidetes bacterium]|nr:twin-arginine translocase TatA/TatE family subunit [Bacteroidota bacterium]MCL5025699.1 twin-arginine translocase TatA/TatE family subunit [Chloroflexota bacterium]